MAEPHDRVRSTLTAPRVDFDLGALALGAIGVFLLQLVWRGLAAVLPLQDKYDVVVPSQAGFLPGSMHAHDALQYDFWAAVLGRLGGMPFVDRILSFMGMGPRLFSPPAEKGQMPTPFDLGLEWWHDAAVGAVLLIVWSVISGAISRVYAVRIARDRSVPFDDGLAFSLSHLRAFVQAPLFIAAAAALFGALVAAAGAASAIPYVGGVLQFVLHPLALVAGIIVVIVAYGGIFGLPVLHAALAAERNGMLDAVSRTFSYLFTRPVTFITGLVVISVVAGIIAQIGTWLLDAVVPGAFWLGASWSADAPNAMGQGFVPGRTLLFPGELEGVSGMGVVSVWATWFWSAVSVLIVRGFVLSYVVGGLTDLYFLLRKEVDGTDESQVYTDDEPELDLGDPLPGQPAPPPSAA